MANRSDLLEALDFVRQKFRRWYDDRLLRSSTWDDLDHYYRRQSEAIDRGAAHDRFELRPANECWHCRAVVADPDRCCLECGAPANTERTDDLRYWILLCHEITRHERDGRISLPLAQDLLAEANARVVRLRSRLDEDRVPFLEEADATPAPAFSDLTEPGPAPPPVPRRRSTASPDEPSFLERLLDPATIRWLLAVGGALLVGGIVIWLVAVGLLQEAWKIALLIGSLNLGVLVLGWVLALRPGDRTPAQAVTLLACLLLPFHLWFYHAQGLLTLDGHLWVAGFFLCGLYLISAAVVQHAALVPVVLAGVAGTGLLLIGAEPQRLLEVALPACFLAVLGLVAIHVERAFPVATGPFSRDRFGRAFFWSGHALLALGLFLVLLTQLIHGWLYPVFEPLFRLMEVPQAPLVAQPGYRLLALGLVLAATWGYAYSALIVMPGGLFLSLAGFAGLWSEILLLTLVPWPVPMMDLVIIALVLSALGANYALKWLALPGSNTLLVGSALALTLTLLPIALGGLHHLRATSILREFWPYPIGVSHVLAMAVAAVAGRLAAGLHAGRDKNQATVYLFGMAAASILAAAGVLLLLRPDMPWEVQAPFLIAIPIGYLAWSTLYPGQPLQRSLQIAAHFAVGLMLFFSLGAAVRGFTLNSGNTLNLLLALFFLEAAVFYSLALRFGGGPGVMEMAAAMSAAAVWQLLKFLAFPDEAYLFLFALAGIDLLTAYRFGTFDRLAPRTTTALVQCGNALLALGLLGTGLMTVSEIVETPRNSGLLLPLLIVLIGFDLLAVRFVRQEDWRRFYVVVGVALALLLMLYLLVRTQWNPLQVLQLAALFLGLALLLLGHLGWSREQEEHDDLVTTSLTLGTILVAGPLALGVILYRLLSILDPRSASGWLYVLNEAGSLLGGLALLTAGILCRIRATTIGGALLLAAAVLTLPLYLRLPERLQTTAVYIILGGGTVFGLGLLLSLYRKQLLALPARWRRREGIFRVLTWR